MSLLLNCQSLDKSFGSQRLFQGLSLSVFSGDRIGLIGPNGAGKSTLLKILAGHETADSGAISPRKDVRIGYVPQSNEFPDISPLEVLLQHLDANIPEYERLNTAQTWLSKLGFQDVTGSANLLSGGWKKRLAIAQELMTDPDLLLLDEPTNHLDLAGVLWLEKFLIREVSTFILVSHDRYFLQNLTNRIMEINPVYPEGLISIEGSFEHFLEKKNIFLEGQLQQERSIATKVRRETDWLRESPKARTTKSQARIDKAHEIIQEHKEIQYRNTEKKASIQFESSERQTRQLLVTKNLTLEFGNRLLFHKLDLTLSPGTRLGLIGENGSGKTTLLRLLAGEIPPTQGTIKRADNLKIVYFDQHRMKLPLHLTLREALAPDGDYVFFRGNPIHVNGWCKRFLFSPTSLGMPLSKLSGGERARIAIAHLMLQPADLLLLDEPANDLDIPTLQSLEENLVDFPGALVLITHDRCLLERVCNKFLALGDPEQTSLFAEFSQWESTQTSKKKAVPKEKKLSNSQKKDCERLEKAISSKEKEIENLTILLVDPKQSPEKVQEIYEQIAGIQLAIDDLYLQWMQYTEILSD